jgi:hypothetical protein
LLLLAVVAVLGMSVNKLCFSRFDLAWLSRSLASGGRKM